ncbi:phage tail sheath family protein [Paenibacillus glucanolyticus]|uniref:phage tail sheath family protein n=1 Tax=Paenibacillus glucanolyticus TaxID=59843 RepID=UPI00128DB094|nr:phage tail sheath family protein [Paenibacillus glucanolyticus]MPY20641.1 phage tail sheath family protein [Paenibacillus glucanolyticus]
MVDFHGVKTTEVFQPKPAVVQSNTLPLYFGTAPINLVTNPAAAVNTIILANNLEEFRAKLGYSDDWKSFTLCEAAHAHFVESEQGPIAFVNVMDVTDTEVTAPAAATFVDGLHTIDKQGVLKATVTVADGTTTFEQGKDYTLTFDAAGKLVIAIVSGGAIPAGTTSLQVGYSSLKSSNVTASRIIGGTDAQTGERSGLEMIEDVFLETSFVPNLIVAPGWSHDPVVAAVMVAKSKNINGLFEAHAVTDLDANQKYVDIAKWKEENGYTDMLQTNTYPMTTLKGRTYHMSTLVTADMVATDAQNEGVPYQTPSNQPITADGLVYADGTPVRIPFDQANALNANGIVTAIRWPDGFKAWGNYTGAYPEYKDAQRTFIPVRRMFSYIKNNLVLRHWQQVDDPLNRRMIDSVVDSANIWINGLVGAGYLLGGRVEFLAADNPSSQLGNGKAVYRVYVTPPSMAQEIEFFVLYDASYLAVLTA